MNGGFTSGRWTGAWAGVGLFLTIVTGLVFLVQFATGKQTLPELVAGIGRIEIELPRAKTRIALLGEEGLITVSLAEPPPIHAGMLKGKAQLRLGLNTNEKQLSYYYFESGEWFELPLARFEKPDYSLLHYDQRSHNAVLLTSMLDFAVIDLRTATVLTKGVRAQGCSLTGSNTTGAYVDSLNKSQQNGWQLRVVTSAECKAVTADAAKYAMPVEEWYDYGCPPGRKEMPRSFIFSINPQGMVTGISHNTWCRDL